MAGIGSEEGEQEAQQPGLASRGEGKYEEAETTLRAAIAGWEAALGGDHPDVARGHANLGRALEHQGKYAEAEIEIRFALARQIQATSAEHPEVAATRQTLAFTLAGLGRVPEALVEARTAIAVFEQAFSEDHPDLARSRRVLARLLLAHGGDVDEAARSDPAPASSRDSPRTRGRTMRAAPRTPPASTRGSARTADGSFCFGGRKGLATLRQTAAVVRRWWLATALRGGLTRVASPSRPPTLGLVVALAPTTRGTCTRGATSAESSCRLASRTS